MLLNWPKNHYGTGIYKYMGKTLAKGALFLFKQQSYTDSRILNIKGKILLLIVYVSFEANIVFQTLIVNHEH